MRLNQLSILPSSVLLENEARSLLTRLDRVEPFSMQETTVPAASIPRESMIAIDRMLLAGRSKLRTMVLAFIRWIRSPRSQGVAPQIAQRRFTILRLRFNAALTQLDIFADALTQRSESETGILLSGLDVAAKDALILSGNYYEI